MSNPTWAFVLVLSSSACGRSLPTWLLEKVKVLVKRYVMRSKYEPLIDEVDLVSVNPTNAKVRYPCGCQDSVSLRHLAPLPQSDPTNVKPVDGINTTLHYSGPVVNPTTQDQPIMSVESVPPSRHHQLFKLCLGDLLDYQNHLIDSRLVKLLKLIIL